MKCIVSIEDATPVAFIDVYEEGDRWEKVSGCENCSLTRRKKCCGTSGMLTPDGWCSWQTHKGTSQKPFKCVVKPLMGVCVANCALVYKCVKGSNKGKFRYYADPNGVLR